MPPSVLRTNSPVDSGFSALSPVEDNPTNEPTVEMRRLAKAAKSPDGQIILDYLREKVEQCTTTLKNTDFAAHPDHVTALAVIIANQKLIQEFEATLRHVELSIQTVADAAKRRARL